MNEENSLLLQTQKLTKLPSKLELESSGSGCGMVLIEIELVTGWEAVNPQNLKNMVDTGVQRVEEDEKENKVVLYFDSMPKTEKCINLEIKQVTIIDGAKDAL